MRGAGGIQAARPFLFPFGVRAQMARRCDAGPAARTLSLLYVLQNDHPQKLEICGSQNAGIRSASLNRASSGTSCRVRAVQGTDDQMLGIVGKILGLDAKPRSEFVQMAA